jgi:hypothetical protein
MKRGGRNEGIWGAFAGRTWKTSSRLVLRAIWSRELSEESTMTCSLCVSTSVRTVDPIGAGFSPGVRSPTWRMTVGGMRKKRVCQAMTRGALLMPGLMKLNWKRVMSMSVSVTISFSDAPTATRTRTTPGSSAATVSMMVVLPVGLGREGDKEGENENGHLLPVECHWRKENGTHRRPACDGGKERLCQRGIVVASVGDALPPPPPPFVAKITTTSSLSGPSRRCIARSPAC